MIAPMRAMPVHEDAGALILRHQQRIRAELLKKAAEEASRTPRWRLRAGTHASEAAPTVAERKDSVLQTFTGRRPLVASGLALALVAAATSFALLPGTGGAIAWIGLAVLGLTLVLGVTRPLPGAAMVLSGVGALGLLAVALLGSPGALLPGLGAAAGLLVTGFVADRFGLACRQDYEEHQRTKRQLDELQPVHEEAGVLKWPHASLVFDRELARAHRYGHPLTLLRVMVEDWDAVRDDLGPEEASQVLAEVGGLLVTSCRAVDVVAYHGDAKFDLLLPDTADLSAVVVARRVGSYHLAHAGVRLRVGVAPVVGSDGTIDELIRQSEEAAVTASKLGRPFAVHGVTMESERALSGLRS